MTTINKEEVHKFSHSNWWNYNSLESKMLHRLNILRMKFIDSMMDVDNIDVLDVGCGGGIASESLFRCGASVIGIDASKEAIDCAKLHAKEGNLKIDYQHTAIEDFNSKKQFDAVFANDIIEHVESVPLFLQHLERHLKPKGILVISTINKNVLSFVFAKVMAEYVLKLVPKGTHEYSKFLTPNTIKNYLNEGFTHLKTQGFSYNPLTNEFFFEPTALVNYFIVFQKNTGNVS
ncbi:MAG: 2-polyprenyl-6-hydroxyphenyl methylase/3-demethylubiquinone-9 3-methyltransferase [Candidatus Deianiraeaceae bacterium]|jgi:2-polyprenyl-6-hydroxyphenyl methylase/3-demethylubiquinone-9 3-methyltransferase